MKGNILHVGFKTEAQRDRLVDEYTFLGYYVKVVGDRVVVNSKHPKKKPVDKKAEKTDRPRRKFDKRSEER